jgi:hypothetical protein
MARARDRTQERTLGRTQERSQDDTLKAIRNDLDRTFSDMSMVSNWKPQIFRILQEYALENPDLGYTQGMNYVAAAMVLKSPQREDLARRRFLEAMVQFGGFWSPGFPLLNFGVALFVRLVEKHFRVLWAHLMEFGVEPLSFLPNGWLSLFGKWLPLPAVMEVMDFILESGFRGVLAVTLAFFQVRQNRLLTASGIEEILELIVQDSRTSPINGELLVECSRRWLPCVDEALRTASQA